MIPTPGAHAGTSETFDLSEWRRIDASGQRTLFRAFFALLALGMVTIFVAAGAEGKLAGTWDFVETIGIAIASGGLIFLAVLLGAGPVQLSMTESRLDLVFPRGRVKRLDLTSPKLDFTLQAVSGWTNPGGPSGIQRLVHGIPRYNTLSPEAYAGVFYLCQKRGLRMVTDSTINDNGVVITNTRVLALSKPLVSHV